MPESIHDKGYKRILSKKKNFLRLFESFVTQAWVKQIREEDLELVDKSFIPKDFNEKEADIIYKVRFQDKEVFLGLSKNLWLTAKRAQNPYSKKKSQKS